MIVGSKATLTMNELIDRKNRGVKFIEIQTVLGDFDSLEDTLAKKHWIKQNGMKVYAVQVPKENRYGQRCIVGEKNPLWRKENMNLIKKSVILAGKLSDNANPLVIIPLGGEVDNGSRSLDFTKEKKIMFQKDVFELAEYVKAQYPYVTLLFKNNPLCKRRGNGVVYYGYGYEEEFFHWIKELRTPQLGICLDIGNALVTADYNIKEKIPSDFDSISYFLHRYAPLLKMIHLSQIEADTGRRIGYSKDVEEDVVILSEVMTTIYKLSYHAPITINVLEEDPTKAERFNETRISMIDALKKKSP